MSQISKGTIIFYVSIVIALHNCTTNKSTISQELDMQDSVSLHICIRSIQDSSPIEAIVGFESSPQMLKKSTDNLGCVNFTIIPKDWHYFEIYTMNHEGRYILNPFKGKNYSQIDTVIYLNPFIIPNCEGFKN